MNSSPFSALRIKMAHDGVTSVSPLITMTFFPAVLWVSDDFSRLTLAVLTQRDEHDATRTHGSIANELEATTDAPDVFYCDYPYWRHLWPFIVRSPRATDRTRR